MLPERWKIIKDYNEYHVSTHGRVCSYKWGRPHILSPQLNNRGYLRVRLHLNTFNKQELIHRLVLNAFIPNPLHLPFCNHLDGNHQNNYYKNLEWTNFSDNIKHAYKIGKHWRNMDRLKNQRGSNNSWHKITEKQAKDIITSKLSYIELAEKYKICRSHVYNIKCGKRWHYLQER